MSFHSISLIGMILSILIFLFWDTSSYEHSYPQGRGISHRNMFCKTKVSGRAETLPLRESEILLSQYDIWLRHIKVSLRDDTNFKDNIGRCCPFLYIFEENSSQAKPISYAVWRISQLCAANLFHCGLRVSLCATH